MAQIIYDTTTGDIASVFVDTVTVGTLPSGFANKSESGVVNELADKHIDISGPTLEELDYMRFTGPDDQGVLTVETHGVQKVNGNTDVDTALIIDNDLPEVRSAVIESPSFRAGKKIKDRPRPVRSQDVQGLAKFDEIPEGTQSDHKNVRAWVHA